MRKILSLIVIAFMAVYGCSNKPSGGGSSDGNGGGGGTTEPTPPGSGSFQIELLTSMFSYRTHYITAEGEEVPSAITIDSVKQQDGTVIEQPDYVINTESPLMPEFRFTGSPVPEQYSVVFKIKYPSGTSVDKTINLAAFDVQSITMQGDTFLKTAIQFRADSPDLPSIGEQNLTLDDPAQVDIIIEQTNNKLVNVTFPKKDLYGFAIRFEYETIVYYQKFQILAGTDFTDLSASIGDVLSVGGQVSTILIPQYKKINLSNNASYDWTIKHSDTTEEKSSSRDVFFTIPADPLTARSILSGNITINSIPASFLGIEIMPAFLGTVIAETSDNTVISPIFNFFEDGISDKKAVIKDVKNDNSNEEGPVVGNAEYLTIERKHELKAPTTNMKDGRTYILEASFIYDGKHYILKTAPFPYPLK